MKDLLERCMGLDIHKESVGRMLENTDYLKREINESLIREKNESESLDEPR